MGHLHMTPSEGMLTQSATEAGTLVRDVLLHYGGILNEEVLHILIGWAPVT